MASVTDAFPDPESAATKKTAARESFFLEFAKTVRETFPNLSPHGHWQIPVESRNGRGDYLRRM